MKFIDEYRDSSAVKLLVRAINETVTKPWSIMEMCGGQTHSIVKFGIDQLLPKGLTLIHGPGCPVCVTPVELIDKAVRLSSRNDVVLCSFGDMVRVPGSNRSLLQAKSEGGDVRIVYGPLDAVRLAKTIPGKEVVFFAVGFETTAPANAMAVDYAYRCGIRNFSILVSHVRVPPAIEAILDSPSNKVQGFLAAGHVCAIMGTDEYEPLARRYNVPIVVTGFEPVDILQGIYMCVSQLEAGRSDVENQYSRAVRADGNREARALLRRVFAIAPRKWRGIGEIKDSGLLLRPPYDVHDAERRFCLADTTVCEPQDCISGEVLRGIRKPHECGAFGTRCTPESPLGAPMVSSEGACAAYYRYRRTRPETPEIDMTR